MSAWSDATAGLRARWDGLSDRERTMVGWLAVVFAVVVLALITFVGRNQLTGLADDNDAMRRVLKEIDTNRDSYRRLKAKSDQVEARLGKGGVQLEGLLEAAAKETEVPISETNERPQVPVANKKYIERSVDLRLQKVTLDKLAHFLRKIETGPNFVVVTGLSARTRDDRHQELEVEMTVSTWEKAPEAKKPAGGGSGGGAKDSKEK